MNQLTLELDPVVHERFASLREYLAHRAQVQPKPLKTIAADMAPSTLSRKLAPGDHDTQRFNLDDLERYIRSTGDTSAIDYLASKYLSSDESRKLAAVARVERLSAELASTLATLKGLS